MSTTRRTLALIVAAAVPALSQLPLPTVNLPITAIAIDAATPSNVYISLGQGLLRSTDGGLQFRPVPIRPASQPQPFIHEIIVQPDNPRILFVASDVEDGAVFKSTDQGETWRAVNTGIPRSSVAVSRLFQLPRSPLTLYAVVGQEVYKTEDGGEKWTRRGTLPAQTTAFAISPAEPQNMYSAQSTGVSLSSDEGATWRRARNEVPLSANVFITGMAVDPRDPAIVYLAASGPGERPGVYRSSNRGEGFAFVPRPIRYQPVSLQFDANGVLYATAADRGVFYRSANPLRSWETILVTAGIQVLRLAIHPVDPRTIWMGTSVGPYFTTNGGIDNFSRAGQARPSILAPAPAVEFNLTAGQSGRVDLPLRVSETERWNVPLTLSTTNERWLSLSATSTSTPGTVQVRVNTQGLAPGSYESTLRISSPQGFNDAAVPIRLHVKTPETATPFTITTVTGTGQLGNFGDGAQARLAAIGNPDSVLADTAGNIYISDTANHVIRRISPAGVISRFAGTGQARSDGDGGAALLAGLHTPRGLASDSAGNLYVADFGGRRVRLITPDSTIFTLATVNEEVAGLTSDPDGNVLVAAPGLHAVARVDARDKSLTRFAGNLLPGFRGDGLEARLARLTAPGDVAWDAQGNAYIADTENHRIRKVTPAGIISTVAGNGLPGFIGDAADATTVCLNRPSGVATDAAGNVWIADTDNHRIRVLTPQGAIRTVAGNGVAGFSGDNGPATNAQLRGPTDVALDADGNVYVADNLNLRVRRLTPPPRPRIVAGDVQNPADGSPRFAPGSLFRITGRFLTAGSQASADPPWPTTLGETTVTVAGRAAPLQRVSPGEILGQIPYETTTGPVAVQVRLRDQTSEPVSITVQTFAPTILTGPGNQAVAFNEDGSPNSAANPAEAGSQVRVHFIGGGPTAEPVASGAAASADPAPALAYPVTVQVGGLDAEVLSSGLTPDQVGIAQATFRTPSELGDGLHLVVVYVGGASGNSAAISVRARSEPAP